MRNPPMNATHRLHRVKCVFYKKDSIKNWIIVNFVLPRRTSDPHDKTRSWLPIILTFLGLITPQEVAETVARYGVPAPTSGLATRCRPCETVDIFYK